MTSGHHALLAEIAARLDRIPEPCSIAMRRTVSLAAMGLVDDVVIADNGEVTVTLCLTDAACVHFTAMQRYIADEIAGLPGITGVQVVQTLDKLWTPDRERA